MPPPHIKRNILLRRQILKSTYANDKRNEDWNPNERQLWHENIALGGRLAGNQLFSPLWGQGPDVKVVGVLALADNMGNMLPLNL